MLTDEQIKRKWIECTQRHRRGDVISSVDMATELARWVEQQSAAQERDALRAQVEAMKSHPREFLGRTVRAAWVAYCKETGRTDKPSHLASWEEISEWDREVDRQIGEAVRRELLAAALKELDDA